MTAIIDALERAGEDELDEIDRIIRETAMGPIFYGESFSRLCAEAIVRAGFRRRARQQ